MVFELTSELTGMGSAILPTTITRFGRGGGCRVRYSTEQDEKETAAISAIIVKPILVFAFILKIFIFNNIC